MKEKRLTERLSTYWQDLKQDQELPPFDSFNKAALSNLWDYCMLIAINEQETGAQRYQFHQMGKEAMQLRNSGSAAITQRVPEIIRNHQPLYDNGHYMNANSHLVKFRSCMLPFGHDGHVTHVIVGLSRKEFN